MNKEKTKKLTMALVALVMAGSMAISLSACGGPTNDNPPDGPDVPGGDVAQDYEPNTSHLAAGLVPKFDENGRLTYASGTEVVVNVGNNNDKNPQKTVYTNNVLQEITLPDGKKYSSGNLKPAWQAAQDELGVKFVDRYSNYSSDAQIEQAISSNQIGDYNLLSGSSAKITQNTQYMLNLTDYLDYMPNYKAFLDANPAVYYSLTSSVSNKAMYYAPYFDGLNDIEKYVLAEQNWISDMLNADESTLAATTTTYAAQGQAKKLTTTSAVAKSYMEQTGSYEVETTLLDGSEVVTGKVDYDAALSAAKSASSALGQAISAAGLSSYTGTSGNIVDIMNAVINATNGAVTGGQLIKILKEYINVAYTVGGEHYEDPADVFNSISAMWDVDLLVAISRCAVTSPNILGAESNQLANIYGISGRQGTTQRRLDVVAFAGELYGVRGLESRIENTYIAPDGTLKDARQNAESYDLVANLGDMAKEGLVYIGEANVDAARSFEAASPLFMHDYSQTQTTTGFTDDAYGVSPILTPVSKWDTDDNGSHETIMRFTESWRSVKNTGFCVPIDSVRNNPDKLSATLAFIDYLFSNDGQIVMTYGPQSTNGNENPNGWWYADEADVELDSVAHRVSITTSDGQTNSSVQYQINSEYEGEYFVFNNTVYKGMVDYSRAIPKITDANMTLFSGGTVNGVKLNDGVTNSIPASAYSYTNYARHILGTTLPIGNKDQGFEYQCTAEVALKGAAVVSAAVANGTIKHVKLSIDKDKGETMWYLIAPTTFALSSRDQGILGEPQQSDLSGKYFYNNSKTDYRTNVYIDLAFYGFDTSRYICGAEALGNIQPNGDAYVTLLNGKGLETRVNIYKNAWTNTALGFGLIG